MGIEAELAEIKGMVAALLARLDGPGAAGPAAGAPRECYTVEEAAELLGRTPYTVREWCRLGRIHAAKRGERRGKVELWGLSADEVRRIRDEGLLPLDPGRNVAPRRAARG